MFGGILLGKALRKEQNKKMYRLQNRNTDLSDLSKFNKMTKNFQSHIKNKADLFIQY